MKINRILSRPYRRFKRNQQYKTDMKVCRLIIENNDSTTIVIVKGRPVVARRVDNFRPSDISKKNLDLVIDQIEKAGIEYFIVPGFSQTRHRLAININNRTRTIRTLVRAYSRSGVYIRPMMPIQPTSWGISAEYLLNNMVNDTARLADASVIRLFEAGTVGDGSLLYGGDYGCDIEFWCSGENVQKSRWPMLAGSVGMPEPSSKDKKKYLVAPRGNKVSQLVLKADVRKKSTVTVSNSKYDTIKPYNVQLIDKVNFPIDIVYTWVDGSDPDWSAKFQYYRPHIKNNRNNTASRYRNYDELKYSLRSLNMYSAFFRNIFIVTDNQTPNWLDTSNKRIKIIDHKEIFADPSVLPVFNSHAIETQLHHIKGLSEHYIIFNDDVFLGRFVEAERFFHPSGLAKFVLSDAQIGIGEPQDIESAPSSAGKNVRRLLEKDFGYTITNKFKHTPLPQIRSVAYELENRYNDAILKTASSRFRNKNDVAFAGTLHNSYSLITGRGTTTHYPAGVVNISSPDSKLKMTRLLEKKNVYTFCLNESDTSEEMVDEVANTVKWFLERYFPIPSPWEKKK